jgi:hypothetical protein
MNEGDRLLKKINKDKKIDDISNLGMEAPDIDELFKTNNNQDAYFNAIDNFFKDVKDIDTKTDLSSKEVKLLLKLQFYSNIIKMFDTDNAFIDKMLLNYYRLQLSTKRQSRKEFFNAISNIKHTDDNAGWIQRKLGFDKK